MKTMELNKKWNSSITRRKRKFNQFENHNWISLCLLLYLSGSSYVIASINHDLYGEKLIVANNSMNESTNNNLMISNINSTNHQKNLLTINPSDKNEIKNLIKMLPNKISSKVLPFNIDRNLTMLENSNRKSDKKKKNETTFVEIENPIENGKSFPIEKTSGWKNPFKSLTISKLSNFSNSNLNDSERNFNKNTTTNKRIIFNMNSSFYLPTMEQFLDLKSHNNNRMNLSEIFKIKPNKRTFQSFVNRDKNVAKFQSENLTRSRRKNATNDKENSDKFMQYYEDTKNLTVNTTKSNNRNSRRKDSNIKGIENFENISTVPNTNQNLTKLSKISENDNQNSESGKKNLFTNSFHKNRKSNQTRYSSNKNRINSVFENSRNNEFRNNKTISTIKFMDRKYSDGKISLLGLFELTTRGGSRPEGQSELMAAKLAVQHINMQGVLPGYTLELITNDTQVILFYNSLNSYNTIRNKVF
jgi:hypothetical protein